MVLRGVVFGWYHRKNAGDDRLAHCIENWLGDHELTFLPHTYPPPLEVLQNSDYVILGGGSIANQVNGVFKNMRHWINATRIPVFGVSITISSYEEFRKELKVIPETGGMIWVRDQQSKDWLNFQDGVVFAPDISWLFPRDFPDQTRASIVGTNFRPWSRTKWQPQAWQNEISNLFGDTAKPWPLCFGKDSDSEVLRQIVDCTDYPTEFDPTFPSRSQLILAMRYHAIIFAIQAGTPFVAIDNSRKVRDLLEQIGLGKMSIPLDNPKNLEHIVDVSRNELDAQLLKQITFDMSAKTKKVADVMKEKIEQSAYTYRSQKSSFNFKLRRRYNVFRSLF